ncbi:ORF1 [Simian torque teno virus 31]|uniref:Capsid protein n=1 Tax=Simian torque teno virus 31 TaxID=1619219 RepID=A0A0C5IMV2_9VIRU|nr:ORF1 [Simian torque teno virus 31]AJP36567.1 ORF1 [Simian torque teno virus 31]
MAWYGWRRRRRGWGRRRWRYRRLLRGRPRRALRRRGWRRRWQVRRRRWGRRWRRRRHRRPRRRRRYRRRRRRRRTLALRQWNPTTVRGCSIRGWFPFLITGLGRLPFLYTHHMDDIPAEKMSFGGGLAVSRFSLSVLYEEYRRHHNKWSRSNVDLDLLRYHGVSFKFYREPEIDFIVHWSLETPMEINLMTHMSLHPLLLLLNKHKIIIPSMKTRPHGRRAVRLTLPPPRLMTNKWYFTKDFCKVGLCMLMATPCSLLYPWLDPGKTSPCVHFHILDQSYYKHIPNIDPNKYTERENDLKDILKIDGSSSTCVGACHCYTELFRDAWPSIRKPGVASQPFGLTEICKTQNYTNNSLADTFISKANEAHSNITDKLMPCVYGSNSAVITQLKSSKDKTFMHRWGLYSHYFLTTRRLDPQLTGPTIKVGYNPQTDEGKGNLIFLQPLTRSDTIFNPTSSKCAIFDTPLWLALYGYESYCTKFLNDEQVMYNYVLCVRCTYTWPRMYRTGNPNQCDIPLGNSFLEGNMPGGAYPPPLLMRTKWYPCLLHQREFINAVVGSGPFMPRGYSVKSWELTAGYKFRFSWGGHAPYTKQVDDPCKKGTHALPDPDRQRMAVQVEDPGRLDPQYMFHGWDQRRGYILGRAIKRVSEDPGHDSDIPTGPLKRPRVDAPPEGGWPDPERGWISSLLQETPPGRRHSPPLQLQLPREPEETTRRRRRSEGEIPPPETAAASTQAFLELELERQRQQQHRLRKGLQDLFSRLVRTEGGHQVDPRLL